MKRIICLFLFICSFNNPLKAQDVSFGFLGGVNISNLHSSNVPIENLVKSRTSFHLGALTEVKFNNLFALQVEALYSRQGAKAQNIYIEIAPPGELGYSGQMQQQSSSSSSPEINGKYDYLNLPMLAKFYVYKGFNVFGGPQVSILLSAKDTNGSEKMDVSDQLDPLDFGLTGGLGYQFDFGIFVSASYYWGINNISNVDYSELIGFDMDIHQGVIQFSAGYKF